MFRLLINILILQQLLHIGYGERTKDKMYERIAATSACYRRLNATHQVGCSSQRGGSTGVVHFSETLQDLDFILSNGTAPPYVLILPVNYFDQIILHKLIGSGKVSGLLLHRNHDDTTHFTHDYRCPNMLSNYDDACDTDPTWNPFGTGLLFTDIPFPIFYAQDPSEVLKIEKCFNEFNNYSYESQADRSLCSLELKSFMYATTDTLTCRRRSNIISNLNPIKFCDPLGDSNIWASLYPLVTELNNETQPLKGFKYIIIAARMDSTSMFEKTAGANSPVTGMVALLSIAKFLKETLKRDDVINARRNVLFMLFNGEAYDYIGSQRMLYDMSNGNFPVDLDIDNDFLPIIKPEDISLFIELSQLGNSKKNVFVHYLKDVDAIRQFYENMQANNHSLQFKNVPKSTPPASLHTFLKYDKDFPGLIISDHETSYANHFYHSIYDGASNIGFKYYNMSSRHDIDDVPFDSIQYFIANLSVAVGAAVYENIKGTSFTVPYDASRLVPLINELFLCYTETPQCKLQNATHLEGKLPKSPFDLYVGVDHVNNYATTFTALTLGWLTADVENSTGPCVNKTKSYAYKFYNLSKSLDELNVIICYKVTMNMTDAVSPAFIIADYNWTSGMYSSWTESTWNELNVRMFLKPSSTHERMTISFGIFTLISSFIIVYFISSRSHILFTSPLPTEAPTDC